MYIIKSYGINHDGVSQIKYMMLYVNNEFECFIRGSKHEKTV
jgi:hypothetical protein